MHDAATFPTLEDVRDRLVSLSSFDRRSVHSIVSRLATDPSRLDRYIRFDDSGYTRTRFHQDERFQILLLSWKPGQVSPIHDHNESICSMYVLQGIAETVSFREREGGGPLIQSPAQRLSTGSCTTVYGGDIHTIACPPSCESGLVTIHFYLPPIDEMLVFDPQTGASHVKGSSILDPKPAIA